MNKENLPTLLKGNQPKAAVMVASALIALTSLLSACGGGSEATPTPASVPTQVPTAAAAEATATTATGSATTTANGALTETQQAAQSAGITAGAVSSGTANVSVITSTNLITGTQVVTNVQVSTNTAVIEQQLITQVITNTALVSNVVQSTQTSNAVATAIITETAQLTPESASGSAAATNVTVTPLPLTPTPTIVVQLTRVVTATAIVTKTEAVTAVATPMPNQTPQPAQGQTSTTIVTSTGTAPIAAGTIFTGVTDAQGKTMLASTLLNSKFQTSDGDVTGKLDDMVVDLQSSQLLYLILTYGGVLDVGETKVAVPVNALSLKSDGEFLLNIPPEDLKNFPKLGDDWPQAGSPNWDGDVRAFWQKEGFPVGFDTALSGSRIRRTADWTGAPLNDVGLGEGTVQDAIVALDRGAVPYVLVSFANAPAVPAAGSNVPVATATSLAGGVISKTSPAGDNNWYAVPLTAFDPQNAKLALRSDVNAATFEGAPRFNRDSLGDNPFLPTNYDKDWVVFWKKLTTPNP